MLITHYILKSSAFLPPSPAKFVCPEYSVVFTPNPEESLSNFLSRIKRTVTAASTAQNDDKLASLYITQLSPIELEEFVVASLIETTPKHQLLTYFSKQSLPPNLSQLKSFAKTAAKQLVDRTKHLYSSLPSIQAHDPEQRASLCLKCPFHKSRSSFSKMLTNMTTFLAPKTPKNPQDLLNQAVQKELASPTQPSAKIKQLSKNKYLTLLQNTDTFNTTVSKLGTCGMCGCSLQAKVLYHISSVLAGVSPNQLTLLLKTLHTKAASTCWILSEALSPLAPQNTRDLLRKKLKYIQINEQENTALSTLIESLLKTEQKQLRQSTSPEAA